MLPYWAQKDKQYNWLRGFYDWRKRHDYPEGTEWKHVEVWSNVRLQGVVKPGVFTPNSRGFLLPQEGRERKIWGDRDWFVHQSDIQRPGYRGLVDYEKVEFTPGVDTTNPNRLMLRAFRVSDTDERELPSVTIVERAHAEAAEASASSSSSGPWTTWDGGRIVYHDRI